MKHFLAVLLVAGGVPASTVWAQQDSAALAHGFVTGGLPGQQDAVLQSAVQLATQGLADSARAIVGRRLAALGPEDPLYPEALFVAGVVANRIDSARTYFRRVSIEYSQSGWADRALLRLTQLAFAAGDYTGAARTGERIVMDYPMSGVRAEAAYWVGRSQLELGRLEEGCRHLRTAQESGAADFELANRARFYLQRCAAVAAEPRDTATTGRDTATRAGPPAYSVQVAAVSNVAAADEAMRALHQQGYESRVVRDSDGLFKVRVGRFARRDQAQTLAAELRRRLGGNPFVVEER